MSQRSLVVNFVGDTASLEAAFKRVGTQLGGLQAAGQRMSSVGSSMTRNITLPVIGLGVAAGKMASDFQAAMERLHTQAGVSQKAVAALSKGLLDMAGKVGFSPDQLAAGMYHVASSLNATLQPAQRTAVEMRVLRTAAEGAAVGHADLVDVTNALDAAVVSGIQGVQNYSQAMGALNAIVGAGDMTMQDLADALGTGLLAPMKTYGLTLKDVGGALAVFGDNNIRGADAATKLISAVRIMAAPSKAAAKELGTVGLSTLQLANDMRQGGIVQALSDLKKHLDDAGLTASQQGLVIARAFGGRQSTGVQVLLSQLERLRAKTKDVGDGAKGFGKEWGDTQQTAQQKTARALSLMKADLTKFGTEALPTLLKVGGEVVHVADEAAHAFNSLPKGAQDAIITGGLITAGVGPALHLVGNVTKLMGGAFKLAGIAVRIGTLGKIGGDALKLGKSVSAVGRMEVGTLIAKSMVGGGGGVPGGGGAASAAEKDAAKVGEGAGGATVLTRAKSLIGKVPESAVALAGGAAGVGVLYGSAAAVRAFVGLTGGSTAPSTQQTLQALGLAKPTLHGGPTPGFRGAPTGSPTAIAHGGLAIPASAHSAATATVSDAQKATSALQNLGKYSANLFAYLAKNAAMSGDLKWRFADTLATEMLKTHNVGTKGVERLIGELNKLPPAARASGAESMIQMAQQLQARGQLPKDSTERLRAAIVASYTKMRGQAGQQYELMGQNVAAQTGKMVADIESGYPPAISAASKQFLGFASNVRNAMSTGTIAAGKGTQIIANALNTALKAFGEKPLPITAVKGLSPTDLAFLASGQVNVGGLLSPHARGGLVQFGRAGDRGADSIPVSMGGVPIVVGAGEVGAVLTGDQQAFLNARTADVGGLPGVFSSFRTQHAQTRRFASGGMVRGFASGGVGYGQLEGLWDRAGGNPQMAAVMAAIAEAESGGNPSARNPSGASGLWQILGLPFAGNPFDPLTNARMAVSKFQSQGLGAWVTYTSGAFRQFLNGAVPALGGLAQIPTPKVTGSGTIANIVRGALGLEAKGANAYLARLAPAGGAASALGPAGGGFDPSQLGLFDGLQVAKWIIPELAWARAHGWAGQVTSGYRSPSEVVHGVFATAPQGQSEHRLDLYPGGAVDVSDYAQFAQIIRGFPGAEKLIQLGIDPLHFSGTGHARGGLLGASTGYLGKTSKAKPKASKVPRGKSKRPGKLPKFRPLPGFGKWSDQLNALATQTDEWGNWQGFIQSLHGSNPTEALVTMPDGSQVVNWDGMTDPSSGQFVLGINQRLSQIGSVSDRAAKSLSDTELGLDETILSLLLQEQGLAGQAWTAFGPWLAKMRADQEKRQDQVATYNRLQQLKERLPKEKADREYAIRRRFGLAIHKVQNAASTATFSGSQLLNEQLAGLGAEKRSALAGVPTGKPGGWSGSASGWGVQRKKELSSIATEFAGRSSELRAVAKRHNLDRTLARSNALFGLKFEEQQELHKLSDLFSTRGTKVTDRMRRLSQAKQYLTADKNALNAALQSGGFRDMLQGDLDPIGQLAINVATKQQIDIPTLLREAAALTGTIVPPSSLSSNAGPVLTGTLGFSYQGQNYVAGLASGGLLGNLSALPPFGGSFAQGGIVPGRPGEPRTIIAHGGEEYLGINGERKSADASGLTAALAQLTATLCQHDETVKANTRAIGTSTRSGRLTYDRGGYASLSSDDSMALGVGS